MSLSDTPESIIELLEEVIEEATEDKEDVASKAKSRWTMAYRAVRKGSDEDVFTTEKFQGKNFFVKLSTSLIKLFRNST